jgi:hypothetical protein
MLDSHEMPSGRNGKEKKANGDEKPFINFELQFVRAPLYCRAIVAQGSRGLLNYFLTFRANAPKAQIGPVCAQSLQRQEVLGPQ